MNHDYSFIIIALKEKNNQAVHLNLESTVVKGMSFIEVLYFMKWGEPPEKYNKCSTAISSGLTRKLNATTTGPTP